MLYVNLDDMKRYRNMKNQDRDDDLLLSFLIAASRFIDTFCKRTFYPTWKVRKYDYSAQNNAVTYIGQRLALVDTLKVQDDLLELVELKTDNGTRTIALADVLLKCGDEYDLTPYDRIIIKLEAVSGYFGFSGSPQQAHQVTGIFGYHNDYARAWLDSLDTLATGINDTVRVLAVNDAAGADAAGIAPRFKRRQVWRIENEFVEVIEITGNSIEVERGKFGSTAVAHSSGSAIKVFQPIATIVQATRRITNWLYTQKDSLTDNDRAIVTNTGITILPARLPNDITMLINPYNWGRL